MLLDESCNIIVEYNDEELIEFVCARHQQIADCLFSKLCDVEIFFPFINRTLNPYSCIYLVFQAFGVV